MGFEMVSDFETIRNEKARLIIAKNVMSGGKAGAMKRPTSKSTTMGRNIVQFCAKTLVMYSNLRNLLINFRSIRDAFIDFYLSRKRIMLAMKLTLMSLLSGTEIALPQDTSFPVN